MYTLSEAELTLPAVIFYMLGIVILTATGLAVTRRQPVHAVLYLIVAFLGTAALFFLLGAPLLAAFVVIIYAGAILVLVLFVIMLLQRSPREPVCGLSGVLPCFWESSFSPLPLRRSSRTPAAESSSRALSPSPATSVVSSSTDTGWPLRSSPFCFSLLWWLSFT